MLAWLSHLDEKQFSDCSWIILLPSKLMSHSIFPLGFAFTPTQETYINEILEPLERITGKIE